MITKNFKMLVACLLQSAGSNSTNGFVPAKDVFGNTRYLGFKLGSYFPSSKTVSVTFSNQQGIQLGSGNTPASENDYTLDSQITSGLSASTPTQEYGVDASGNPFVDYTFTLTNSTGSPIEVKEIGYAQILVASANLNASASNYPFLLDRTVLDNPITIPANDYAAVKYTLKTVLPT